MTLTDFVFFTAVSTLLLHELDAVNKKEWRLLFVLRRVPDDGALRWFILLHLPLFVALSGLIAAGPSPAVRWVEAGVDGLVIVHAGLHERLAAKGHDAFDDRFSRGLIWSAAGLAVLHLLLVVPGAI